MGEKQQRADGLPERLRRTGKTGAPHRPMAIEIRRHLVGRDRGRRQEARDGERDRPLDMPGHEPVGVLDQRAHQPPFGETDIRRRLYDNRIDPCRHRRRRAEAMGEAALDRDQVARAAFRLERFERDGGRWGRDHDDPVRDRRPGGRLDSRLRQPFEPIGLGQDRGRRNDQRSGERRRQACGELAPARNLRRPVRRAAVRRQNKDLAISGAPRSQDRAPDKTEPQNSPFAIPRRRLAARLNRGERRRKKDKNWRCGHDGSAIPTFNRIGSSAAPLISQLNGDC